MYAVQRSNGSRFTSRFFSYEEARRFARKKIRALVAKGKAKRMGLWDGISRNPVSVSAYGYFIKQV